MPPTEHLLNSKDIKWVGGGGLIGKAADLLILDDVEEPRKTMNKFAPVAPYHIYQQFSVNGYIPDTVLLLAHDVVKHKDRYDETFSDPKWNNTTIIMDNSLVELGTADAIDVVFEAADTVCADIVVLPDVMGVGIASAKATIDNWNEWNYHFKDYQKMVVLHGDSYKDFFTCAENVAEAGIKPDWISLPRKLNRVEGLARYDWIKHAQVVFPNIPIHLLGFSDSIWDDLHAASHPSVKSIDSAVPLRLPNRTMLSVDAGKRPEDWFETVQFDLSMIGRCRQVDQIINRYGNDKPKHTTVNVSWDPGAEQIIRNKRMRS